MRASRIDVLPLELRRKWAAARVWAAHTVPYLATALLALEPVVVEDESLDLQRFPTDLGWHVHISPNVLAASDVREVGCWLVHQVSHLLRDHPARYPGHKVYETGAVYSGLHPDQQRWNAATDAEINDDLAELPAQALTPEQLSLPGGGIAEQYWRTLVATDDQLAGDCGSGCDGQPRVWNCGWDGLSELGRKLTARDTAGRIRERNRNRDDIPAGWRRWAEDVLEPSVNWRRQLAALLRRGIADVAGRVDFSYRRPSRRAPSMPGVILPSLRQPLPAVTMVVDTSGSMSDTMLAQALGEVAGVLRALGIGRRRLRVIACDAEAYGVQNLKTIGDVELAGGGGSDIRTGFALAARTRPDLIVALTDGHTPWPENPPVRTRVVVGLLDPTGQVPPWAESVLVGERAVE